MKAVKLRKSLLSLFSQMTLINCSPLIYTEHVKDWLPYDLSYRAICLDNRFKPLECFPFPSHFPPSTRARLAHVNRLVWGHGIRHAKNTSSNVLARFICVKNILLQAILYLGWYFKVKDECGTGLWAEHLAKRNEGYLCKLSYTYFTCMKGGLIWNTRT